MHIASLSQILVWIIEYKYWIIFPLAVLEGPIITIISAFLASQGHIGIVPLFVVALSGDLVGDFLHYAFGRWMYQYALSRSKNGFGKTGKMIANTVTYLKENPGKTIMFGKWTHAAGFAVLIGAWAAKVTLSQFFGYCTIGATPKIVIFMLTGYLFGSAYTQIDTYMGHISLVLLVLFLSIAAYFIYRKRS